MKKWEKYSREEIEAYVKESYSFAALARKLGYSKTGGSYLGIMSEMVAKLSLDTSHFRGQAWNKNNFNYERFRKGISIKSAIAVDALSYIRGRRCECCGLDSWSNRPIPLEVHHKDGDRINNELKNLVLLCPNCHALTDNYRGKNINRKANSQIADSAFVVALNGSINIRQALMTLGLAPKGANYQRARDIIFKHNITHLM